MKALFLIVAIYICSLSLIRADENLVALEYAEISGDVTRGWFASTEAIREASDSTPTFQEVLGRATKYLDEEVKQLQSGPLGESLRDVASWSFTRARVIPVDLNRTRRTPSEWKSGSSAGFFYLLAFWALDEEGSSIELKEIGILSDLSIIELTELHSTDAEKEWEGHMKAEIDGHQQDEALKP